MIVANGLRLATALACALLGVSCGGPTTAPAASPTPSVAGPTIRLADAGDRLTTYAERIEDEVLAPYAKTIEPFMGVTEPPSCPGIGEATNAQFDVSGENVGNYVAPIRKWLTGNGFAVAEKAVDGARTVTGRSADGFTVEASLAGSSLGLSFTSPCAWPGSVPGGPTKPLAKATPKTRLEARSIELACEKPEFYVFSLNAPPYRGPGPHPVTTHTELPEDTVMSGFYLPEGWEPVFADPGAAINKRKSQLVVCVTAVPGEAAGSVSCQYDRPSTTVDFGFSEATYQVTVLTARTGQKIASFTLSGTESDQESCPAAVQYTARTELLRGFDSAALHAKLRSLITGRR